VFGTENRSDKCRVATFELAKEEAELGPPTAQGRRLSCRACGRQRPEIKLI